MKSLPKEDRAGLYITVIAHLVVVIVLLIGSLAGELAREESFILDFSKIEEIEKLQKELSIREEISRKLDMIIDGNAVSAVKNVAVDRSALKDDRGTDAEKLYKDAERLQKELNSGYSLPEDDYVETPAESLKEKEKKEDKQYSGPSVLSWELEGRKASRLPIPAYRCMGEGEVKVLISVDPSGTVVKAVVDESCSSPDGCLRAFAIRASRLSKFSSAPGAGAKQQGYISYRFIAQ